MKSAKLTVITAHCIALWFSGVGAAQDRSTGTAFAVTNDGVYVTCAHLVSGKTEITLTSTSTAKVIALDEDHDLALLRTSRREHASGQVRPAPTSDVAFLALAASDQPTPGDKVWCGSFPHYENPERTHMGVYLGTMMFGTLTLLAMEGDPLGDGGPVVDQMGRVIGITRPVRPIGNGKRGTSAIPVTHLRALLKTAGISPKEAIPLIASDVPKQIEKSLAFLEATAPTGADYGRDRISLDYYESANSARMLAEYLANHGVDAKCRDRMVVIASYDKHFSPIALLPYPNRSDYGQGRPTLVARERLDVRSKYRPASKAAEVVKWADSMERIFPGLLVYVDSQSRLCVEQVLSVNTTVTWGELSAALGEFQSTVEVLARGPGCDGFRKYIQGFEDWAGGLGDP